MTNLNKFIIFNTFNDFRAINPNYWKLL